MALNAAFGASHKVEVAGCLPPVFGSYRPDLFDANKAVAWIHLLAKAQEPFVDFWLAETVTSIEEARVINDTLGENRKPLWMAYNLAEGQRKNAKPRLRNEEDTVEDAMKASLDMGVQAVLFNCNQPEDMERALKVAAKILKDKVPYGAYANAFAKPKVGAANEEITELRDLTPAEYAQYAIGWLELGATIIGGCCGIGPEHIKALRKLKN